MVNYQNAKIYKIISNQTDNVYVGSTTYDQLCQRMAKHRSRYRCWLQKTKSGIYYSSFEILKYDDAQIVLIENFPCKSKDELTAREQYYIDHLNGINKHKAQIQGDEDEKREYVKRKHREWLSSNREEVLKKQRERMKKLYRERKAEKKREIAE